MMSSVKLMAFAFEGMKALFGMTWHMEKVFMLLSKGWSGLSVLFLLVVALQLCLIYITLFVRISLTSRQHRSFFCLLLAGMKVNGFKTTWKVMELLRLRYLTLNPFQGPSMFTFQNVAHKNIVCFNVLRVY